MIQTIHVAFNNHYFIEFHRDLLSFFSIRLIYKFFYKQRIFFNSASVLLNFLMNLVPVHTCVSNCNM